LGTHHKHFPEEVPLDGVVTRRWREKVFEQVKGETKVNRHDYEMCVLEKLERALKCKEVWVEGSYAFRSPSEDMPGDWSDEPRRALHYQRLGKPLDAQTFVRLLRERLTTALEEFNRVLPGLQHLRIFHPNKKEERGLWALAKLEPQPEPQSLGLIKERISSRYGILDLLDVFVEADRMVDFTRFFTHSGAKEVRSREALRPLLILDLFAEGANLGIKRVANANNRYSYEELLYVRKTYFSCPSPKPNPACISNISVRPLAVHTGGEVHRLQRSRSPCPTPAAALPSVPEHPWQAINASAIDGNTRSRISGSGANAFR